MTDTLDKAVMGLSGGLIVLGVVGGGLVEFLAGPPYVPTTESGEVLTAAAVAPNVRAALVLAALLVLFVYAVYKLATPVRGQSQHSERATAGD